MVLRHRAAILLFSMVASTISAPTWAQTSPPPTRKAPQKAPQPARPKTPPKAPAPVKPPPLPEKVAPAPVDVTIASTYTTGEKTATSTMSLKGQRQRIEVGDAMVTLVDCDAKRSVQLNSKTRTFLATPFETASAPPSAAPATGKGGQITYTTTLTDTGEKKSMFGYPARRLLTVVTKEASASACDKKPERIETDGWYVDLPPSMTCAAPERAVRIQVDPKQPNCRDEVRLAGSSPSLAGYPVFYTMTATAGSDKPAITKLEVTALTTADLPAASFEVPEGYLEVNSVVQLMADHRPGEIGTKKPGVVRIGVAAIDNKTDTPFASDVMSQALAESLSESTLDIVRLTGASPAALIADAKAKECDYVLQNTVSELKKPGKGVLGKLAGSSGEAITAKVDYVLLVPGLSKPALTGSERSGTSTLQTAVGAAKRVAVFVAPFIMAQYSFMNAFSAMNGGASSLAMGQTSDPVLGSVFRLLDRGSGKQTEQYSTEESAIAAAMEKEILAVVAEMQKRKK